MPTCVYLMWQIHRGQTLKNSIHKGLLNNDRNETNAGFPPTQTVITGPHHILLQLEWKTFHLIPLPGFKSN